MELEYGRRSMLPAIRPPVLSRTFIMWRLSNLLQRRRLTAIGRFVYRHGVRVVSRRSGPNASTGPRERTTPRSTTFCNSTDISGATSN